MKFPRKITYGDKYNPAMKITDQKKANEYFEACVLHTMQQGVKRVEAVRIERDNLGYYAGYFDDETQQRVERLFRCAHPVFGKIIHGSPPAEEAFEMGKRLAAKGEGE